jgi:hypothetical protein
MISTKLIVKLLILVCVAEIVAGYAQPSLAQPPGAQLAVVGEEFALAFLHKRGDDRWPLIEVSRSRDNVTWTDANFPDCLIGHVRMKRVSGVSICGSSDRKKLTVVFNNKYAHAIYSVTGLVAGDVVNWGSVTPLEGSVADGAPSCAMLDDGKLVVGMLRNSEARVGVYSSIEGGTPKLMALAIPTTNNSRSSGQVVAVAGNTVTMAWWAPGSTETCLAILIAQYDLIVSGEIAALTRPRTVVLQLTSPASPCAMGAPALFSDGKHFYVGVIQKKTNTPGSEVDIYRSTNLDVQSGFAFYRGAGLTQISASTYISGAAKESGEIVFGKVRDKASGKNDVEAVKAVAGGPWSNLGRVPWTHGGDDASFRPFGFARLGSQKRLLVQEHLQDHEKTKTPSPVK